MISLYYVISILTSISIIYLFYFFYIFYLSYLMIAIFYWQMLTILLCLNNIIFLLFWNLMIYLLYAVCLCNEIILLDCLIYDKLSEGGLFDLRFIVLDRRPFALFMWRFVCLLFGLNILIFFNHIYLFFGSIAQII